MSTFPFFATRGESTPSGELIVEPGFARERRGVYLRTDAGSTYGPTAWLSEAAARDLGAWLATRYGLAPYRDGKPGDMVKVIANAEGIAPGTYKVVSAVDSDDEYDLEDEGYVTARFVVHPDAILPEDAKPEAPKSASTPAPRLAVGTPAVIVTDDAQANDGASANLPKGTPVVINGDMPSGSYRVTAHIDGALKTRYVRATDVALSLPVEEAPKDATPTALKVGDVVALKPGAKTSHGSGVFFADDVTRVKVVEEAGSGSPYVKAVDGSGVHGSRANGQYVGRAYLGDPITEAAWAVGDEAIVAEGGKYLDHFLTGERVRLTEVNPAHTDGTRQVRATSLDRPGTAWYTRTDAIRRP